MSSNLFGWFVVVFLTAATLFSLFHDIPRLESGKRPAAVTVAVGMLICILGALIAKLLDHQGGTAVIFVGAIVVVVGVLAGRIRTRGEGKE
jgi:hypothetical protein